MKKLLATWLLGISIALGAPAFGQELDMTGVYRARTTLMVSDNDIFALNTGLTWQSETGGTRLGLTLGIRNEDWTGIYPRLGGVEALTYSNLGDTRRGIGARLDWAADRSTTGELIYGWERFSDDTTFRLTAGLQGVLERDDVQGRDRLAAFGVVEKSWYLNENAALRAGAQLDDAGFLMAAQGEIRLGRWPVSFFMEWTHTISNYRGERGYNDLSGGFVYVFDFKSLKSRDRRLPLRLTQRYAAVQ